MYECMSILGVLIHVRIHENFRCFNSSMNACKLIFNSCMNACKLIFDSCMNAWKIDLMNFFYYYFYLFFIIFLCMYVWMKCNFRKCIIFWSTTLIILIFLFSSSFSPVVNQIFPQLSLNLLKSDDIYLIFF